MLDDKPFLIVLTDEPNLLTGVDNIATELDIFIEVVAIARIETIYDLVRRHAPLCIVIHVSEEKERYVQSLINLREQMGFDKVQILIFSQQPDKASILEVLRQCGH
jgi:hypothetical protein